jgi:hypothetical protein
MLSPGRLAWLVNLQFGVPAQFRAGIAGDLQAFSPGILSSVIQAYRGKITPDQDQ